MKSEVQIAARMSTAECIIARKNYVQGKGILRIDSKRRMSAPSSLIQVQFVINLLLKILFFLVLTILFSSMRVNYRQANSVMKSR